MKNVLRMSFFISVVFFSLCYGLSSFALSVPSPTLDVLLKHLSKKLSQQKHEQESDPQKKEEPKNSSCNLEEKNQIRTQNSDMNCKTAINH